MPGKVYCFNTYNEIINQLSLNGLSAGSVSGWSTSPPNLYVPQSLVVPRVYNGATLTTPAFANDMPTQLAVWWDSYNIEASVDLASLPSGSIEDDIILYIAVNQLTLMNTRGLVLRSQTPLPRGGASILDSELPTTQLA